VLGLDKVMKVDDDIGMTIDRIVLLVAWMAITFILIIPTGRWLVSFINPSVVAGWLGGLIPWIILMGFSLPRFLVYVREDAAFIGVDALSGVQHIFQTRLNVKRPWETVHKRNFIDLGLAEISETVTYNTLDGARYAYGYLILYRPSVSRLPIYRAVKQQDIIREVQAIVRSALSIVTLGKTAEQLGSQSIAQELEREVRKHLGQLPDDDGHELEYRFGIDFVNISLTEPQPDKDIIEARQAKIIAGLLRSAMDTLRGEDKELSAQEAANLAAMLNKESITKQVHSYELGTIPAVIDKVADRVVAEFTR
jgi:hypothetical protein